MGKMAIAVSRSNPEKVYALIESDSDKEAGGLFVSTNAGKNWSQITNDHRLVQRAWYYIELFIDPKNENTIYVLSAPALRSTDGGKTWETLSGTHGDFHDLWINPDNPNNFIISNDGGAAITFDSGKSWSTQSNMPTAQFYRINVDNQFPYRIYGGQQDNTSVVHRQPRVGERRDYDGELDVFGRRRERVSRIRSRQSEIRVGRQLPGHDRGARYQTRRPARTSWPRPFSTSAWTRRT